MKRFIVIALLLSAACIGRTDPDVLRVRSNCQSSLVGDECIIEGGRYGPGGLSSIPFCNCPAEDAGKECDSALDWARSVSIELRVLDEEIDERVAAIRDGRDWPCQRGCDHCCRSLNRPPQLSEAEWRRIDEILGDEQHAEARRRALNESDRVCPFLNQARGGCSIYAVRPIARRTYGYYVERGRGLWCGDIERAVEDGLGDGVVFGNHDGITSRFGTARPLAAWLTTPGPDDR